MKERNEIDPALFSTGANILEKSNNGTKYQIECDTPNGTMQCIHLFPGIDLAYTSFQAFSCFSRNKAMPHILEIAYCSAGRYECEYKRDYFTYLGEGDIAISVLSPHREPPTFPTGNTSAREFRSVRLLSRQYNPKNKRIEARTDGFFRYKIFIG